MKTVLRRTQRAKVVLKRSGRTPQAALQAPDLHDAALDRDRFAGKTYLDPVDLADYLGLPSADRARRWATANAVPDCRVGRLRRFRRRDVDQVVQRTRELYSKG